MHTPIRSNRMRWMAMPRHLPAVSRLTRRVAALLATAWKCLFKRALNDILPPNACVTKKVCRTTHILVRGRFKRKEKWSPATVSALHPGPHRWDGA